MQVVIALLVLLILTMVAVTVSIKSLRTLIERWQRMNQEKLEPLLEEFLHHDEGLEPLQRVSLRRLDRDLTPLVIERIRYVHGSSREQLLGLVRDLGLVEKNQTALRSRRRWRRARAAELLGHFGDAAQVEDLGALVADKDETVRAVAVRSLAQLGTPDAVQILVRTLDDPSELTRLRISENLERLGSQAVPDLISYLVRGLAQNADTGARGVLAAVSVLGGMRSYQARPELRAAIDVATNAAMRAEAVWALGRCGGPADVRLLASCSRDRHWEIRKQAADALGSIGDTSAVPALEELMADSVWAVRAAAGDALARMGLVGEGALLKLVSSGDADIRECAVRSLETSGATARLALDLASEGQRGTRARTATSVIVRAGATRHLTDLLPELGQAEREVLGRILAATTPPHPGCRGLEVGGKHDC